MGVDVNPLNNAPIQVQHNQPSTPSIEGDFHEEKPEHKKSQKLTIIEGINRWSAYISWFSLGVTVAHISRLFGTWVLFFVFQLSVSGYLMFINPETNETNIYLRRACGLAVFLSLIAYWDFWMQIAVLPITVVTVILPLWLVAAVVIFALFLISFVIALAAN
jgi:hypothetical protein